MSRGEIIAAVSFVFALVAGTTWYLVDRHLELRDFGADVAAMEFTLALGSEENPKWDEDEEESEMEALVVIDSCWLVELERGKWEDHTLPDAKGRRIERIVFGEIHSARNFLGNRSETDILDFNDPLSPTNISAYLSARKDQYPCAS